MTQELHLETRARDGTVMQRGRYRIEFVGLSQDGDTVEVLGIAEDFRRITVRVPTKVLEEIDSPAASGDEIPRSRDRATNRVLDRLGL